MVGAGARLIMREVVPGISVATIVLAYGSPLSFAEVRSPLLPRDPRIAGLVQPLLLSDVDKVDCGHDISLLRWGEDAVNQFGGRIFSNSNDDQCRSPACAFTFNWL